MRRVGVRRPRRGVYDAVPCRPSVSLAPPHAVVHGKAIVFARGDVTVGDTREWLGDPTGPRHSRAAARASRPRSRFALCSPQGPDEDACYDALVRRAGRVYAQLAPLGQDGCMMADAAQRAADLLWRHWQGGTRLDHLPEEVRPATRADGYAVQARLEARSAAPLYGWKIAATSKAGQAHIAVDGPLAGRLLRERVFENGGTVPFGANHMRVAEAEFAFRMKRDLGAPRDGVFRGRGAGGGGQPAPGDRDT